MLDCLIAGKLFGAPQKRTSKNGNDFVTGKMRAPIGEGAPAFVTFIAFRDHVCAALMELADGSSIAIAGEMKLGTYQAKDNTHRVSIDVTVHELLTPTHVSRRRQSMKDGGSESEPARNQPPAKSVVSQQDLDDAPF